MLRAAVALLLALASCGGGSGEKRQPVGPVTPKPPQSPARYSPGDPDCDATRRPGTVGTIGEDLVGGRVRVRDFIGCYGPPKAEKREGTRRCLFYATRGESLYWEICAAGGRVVSATGDRSKP